MKTGSGLVQKTFPSHSQAVLSLTSRTKYTATTGEDFEVHLYQTNVVMTSSKGLVYGTVLDVQTFRQ